MKTSDGMKTGILFAAVAVAALVIGAMFLGGERGALVVTQPTVPGEPALLTLAPAACDPQATDAPELRFALRNNENSTLEYNAVTTYVYEGTFSKNNLPTNDAFRGTHLTLATGLPAIGSGFAALCDVTYTIVVPAADAATTSTMFSMKVTRNDNVKIVEVAEQTPLIARVYDSEAKGFVYEATEATAGSWFTTGASWYSTSGNLTGDSDGLTLGTDDYYRYEISFHTNGTATSAARFNDQETAIAIDRQSSTSFDEVSTLNLNGVNLIGNKFASIPTRMAKSNYDEAYLVPNNPTIKTAVNTLDIDQYALSGVNPSDDIVVAMYTAGFAISTQDNGVTYGYAEDDSSETVLYAPYVMTLVMG